MIISNEVTLYPSKTEVQVSLSIPISTNQVFKSDKKDIVIGEKIFHHKNKLNNELYKGSYNLFEEETLRGIFFDRLANQDGFTKQQRWDFVKAVGETFAPTYVELINRNRNNTFRSYVGTIVRFQPVRENQ